MIEKALHALTAFGVVAILYFFGWHTESHYLSRIHYVLLFVGIEFGLTLVCAVLSPLLAVVAASEPDEKKRGKLASNLILALMATVWVNVVWLLPFVNELGPEGEERVCKLEVLDKRLEEIWCLESECFEFLLQLEAGAEPRWVEPPFWQVWMNHDAGDFIPALLAKGHLGLEYADLSARDVSPAELDPCHP